MKTLLPIASWARKDHFHFFGGFSDPYFGVCIRIDCTQAYQRAKEQGCSFFLYYLYQSLRAANTIEPFRYRIEGKEVFIHDAVHASPTINRPDGTFGFAYMDYHADLSTFHAAAKAEMERVQQSTGLVPSKSGDNVIHYSAMPWLDFTSLEHARHSGFADSVPKISFGKVTEHQGRKSFPVSIHVHHALMDGSDVGRYAELFQELMNGSH
ncbi:chloramphenicol acetyltransferase [Deminuibacter soli]|uniref:Chloramphenicol acetyltransferase n=1 Tax=Deminuibacter soli TaxID=2291815 RepID=A0A3E1NCC9_9BACT|nr:chloramphenicol acetyltransferase [Deminuibacter soli]RFM25665.1 chloramphenicol acetyltransferase [Deminuibacter soli]